MAGVLIERPFSNNGDYEYPPQTDLQNFVNFEQGYTPDYEINLTTNNPQAKAVERAIQNGLFRLLTSNQQFWQQLGFAEWFSAMPGGYPFNAQVMRLNGSSQWIPYRSLVANNVSDPLTTPAQWELIASTGTLLGNIPMRAGGTAGPTSEIVSVATNLNTFTTGTWEFISDAVAAASANIPVTPGVSAVAGMLESKAWGTNPNAFVVQRYTDRNGTIFIRGNINGTWTAWTSNIPDQILTNDVSATVNVVKGLFPFNTATIQNGRIFQITISNTNTGAATFTPNETIFPTPRPILGQNLAALQGGELFATGRALLMYRAASNDYQLVFCAGGKVQGSNATANNQFTTLSQVQSLVAASGVDESYLYFIGQA